MSLVPFPDGAVGRFPHIIERNKPGIIGVLGSYIGAGAVKKKHDPTDPTDNERHDDG